MGDVVDSGRMNVDIAPRPVRQNTCRPGVIQVNVSRKHGLEIFDTEAECFDALFEHINATGRPGIEEDKPSVDGCEKGRDHFSGPEKLEIEGLNVRHHASTSSVLALVAPPGLYH